MVPGIATPVTRPRETSRHQAVAAPPRLADGPLAPSPVTPGMAQAGVAGRPRLLPPPRTLWPFLLHILAPDGSCREALSRRRPGRIAQGPPPGAPHTGSACQARKRLPEGVGSPLARHRGQRLREQTPEAGLWPGRRVNMVDGSTIAMPDTAAHQAASPQPRSQQPGGGCPLARLVAVLALVRGALTTLGGGGSQGQRTGALALLRQPQRH
jgi:hypothetical protein